MRVTLDGARICRHRVFTGSVATHGQTSLSETTSRLRSRSSTTISDPHSGMAARSSRLVAAVMRLQVLFEFVQLFAARQFVRHLRLGLRGGHHVRHPDGAAGARVVVRLGLRAVIVFYHYRSILPDAAGRFYTQLPP